MARHRKGKAKRNRGCILCTYHRSLGNGKERFNPQYRKQLSASKDQGVK